jgi:hypothetical protein
MNARDLAEICHNINKAYCEAIGDTSQVEWDKAPSWQRESAIAGVNLHLSDPSTTAEESHKSWLRLKISHGWVWGLNKDADKKEHPCIVPYEKLPKEQQVKDHLFKATIESLRKFVDQGEGNSTQQETVNMAEQETEAAEPQTENRPAAEQKDVAEYQGGSETEELPEPPDSDQAGTENASRDD